MKKVAKTLLTTLFVSCLATGCMGQQRSLRDGAGYPVPRNTGTPGRSGSYGGTGYPGGSTLGGLPPREDRSSDSLGMPRIDRAERGDRLDD